VSDPGTKPVTDAYIHRLEAEFLCDELVAVVNRLRELVRDSQRHRRTVFLSLADDAISDLLEAVDRGWPRIEEIAGDLKT
jgi:hypothetical protein